MEMAGATYSVGEGLQEGHLHSKGPEQLCPIPNTHHSFSHSDQGANHSLQSTFWTLGETRPLTKNPPTHTEHMRTPGEHANYKKLGSKRDANQQQHQPMYAAYPEEMNDM